MKNEKKPIVSIIINNYNYGKFLKEAIDSALKQSYSPIEVIVVDDGSTDNSREVILSYGSQIIPVLKKNEGQASAFNAGFAASKGEIVCFLDADDLFFRNKVTKIVSIFTKDLSIGWCFHTLELVDFDTKTILGKTRMFPNWNPSKISKKYYMKKDMKRGKIPIYLPPTSGLCFKRSVLEQILPMPTTFIKTCADDYLRTVAAWLSPGFVLTEALCEQRIHGQNSDTELKHQKRRSIIGIVNAYLLRKNYPQTKSFTNRIFARSLSNYWKNSIQIPEYKTFIKNYFALTSFKEKIDIYLGTIYYSIPFRKTYTHKLSKANKISPVLKSNSF